MQEIKQSNQFDYSFQKKFKPLQLKSFECSRINPACSICTTYDCQYNGLMCKNQKCQCNVLHQKCSFSKLSAVIDKINSSYRQIPSQIQNSYFTILKCYDDMIEILSLKKAEIQDSMKYYGLRSKQIQFMKFVQAHDHNQINGKFVTQLKVQLAQIHQSQAAKPLKISTKIQKIFHRNKKKLSKFLIYLDQQCIDFSKIKANSESDQSSQYSKLAFGSTIKMMFNPQYNQQSEQQFQDDEDDQDDDEEDEDEHEDEDDNQKSQLDSDSVDSLNDL